MTELKAGMSHNRFGSTTFLTFVRSPYPFHSISVQCHPRELAERLSNVEVAQRGDFEARHFMSARIILSLLRSDLSLKRQMEAIAYEHLRNSGCVLVHFFDPPVYSFEAPLICDIVH